MRTLAFVLSSAAVSRSAEMQIACGHVNLNLVQRLGKQCAFAAAQLSAYDDNGAFDLDGHACELLNHAEHSTAEIHEFLTAKNMDSFCQDLTKGRGNRRRQDQRDEEEEENPLDIIQAYGCYCSFESNLSFGKGPPKNDLDRLCRNSFWNYECMKETNPECVDLSIYYVATSRKADWEIEADCELFNEALQLRHDWTDAQLQCARNRCRIDSDFFLNVMDMALESGYSFEEEYKWASAGGTFNNQEECSTGGQQLSPEYECCGSYPYRGPFNMANWACCGAGNGSEGNPYRPAFKACCADGTIGGIGSCDN